jgi:hypothetical protein
MTELNSDLLPTDDPGDNSSGTKLNRAYFELWLGAVNALIHSAENPTVSPADIINEVVEARGDLATLNERISGVIDAAGSFLFPAGTNLDILVTYGESVEKGTAVYMSVGDGGRTAGKFYKPNGTTPADVIHGFAVNAVLINETGLFRFAGVIAGSATDLPNTLTPGTVYYAKTDSSGELTSVKAGNALRMGTAKTSTTLVLGGVTPPDADEDTAGLITNITQIIAGDKTFTGDTTLENPPTVTPAGLTPGTVDFKTAGLIWAIHPGASNSAGIENNLTGVTPLFGPATFNLPADFWSRDGQRVKVTAFFTIENEEDKHILFYAQGALLHDVNLGTPFITTRNVKVEWEIMRKASNGDIISTLALMVDDQNSAKGDVFEVQTENINFGANCPINIQGFANTGASIVLNYANAELWP